MKAVQMTAQGGPEVLVYGEVPEPQIDSPTQIKVRLAAAGINPVDTKICSRGLFYGAAPPAILGCDGTGEVVAVGPEVRRFAVGDRVWFCHGGLGREPGNYAEYSVLEEDQAEFAPSQVEPIHAAAGPLALITAWEALYDRGRLQEGQTVLVHAGAGGVGHLAIQLAKLRGATVITTVSSHDKAELVRSLGADEVIDYRQQDLVGAVNDWTQGRGVDLVLDTVGPAVFRASIPAVAHYGTLVTLLDPGSDLDLSEARVRNLSLAFCLMLTPMLRDLPEARRHHGEILRVCGEWLDAGQLRVVVGDSLPLAQAAEAHRRVQAGHTTGKIVLVP
jgi:NADPH2:quinone reductase